MKNKILKQALFIVLIAFGGFAFSQETVDLKYGFVKGKNYVQNLEVTQNVTQSMGGQDIKVQANVKASVNYAVEDVSPESNATMLISFSGLSVHSSTPGRDTTMNYT